MSNTTHMAVDAPVTEGVPFATGKHALLDAQLPVISLENEDEKPRRSLKKLLIIPAVLLGVVAGVYFGGVAYFTTTSLPNTYVNGQDFSLRSRSEIRSALEKPFSNWSSHVEGDGLSFDMTAENVGLAPDASELASQVFSNTNPWYWPMELNARHEYEGEIPFTVDSEKISQLVEDQIAQTKQDETEADFGGISFNPELGLYELRDDLIPQLLNPALVSDALEKAAYEMTEKVSIGDECLDDDSKIGHTLNTVNAMVGSELTLTLAGEDAYVLPAELIQSWVSIDNSLEINIDEEAIVAWAKGPLSEEFDTLGQKHTFTRADGKEIEVEGGTYGWIINGDETAQVVIEALRDAKGGKHEMVCRSSAASFNPGGREWGSYIDVDITEQHARWYDADDNLLWETDVVTGQPDAHNEITGEPESHSTPTGVYYISEKDTETHLKGPIDPKTNEPSWDSFVNFWMRISNEGVGLHNAPWRSEFGGDINSWYGSHGCINMSYEAAEELYNRVEIGQCVVVHY